MPIYRPHSCWCSKMNPTVWHVARRGRLSSRALELRIYMTKDERGSSYNPLDSNITNCERLKHFQGKNEKEKQNPIQYRPYNSICKQYIFSSVAHQLHLLYNAAMYYTSLHCNAYKTKKVSHRHQKQRSIHSVVSPGKYTHIDIYL